MSQFKEQYIHFEGVSQVTATPSEQLGARREIDGITYVYGYNAGAVDFQPGHGAKVNSSNSGYSFSVTNAASQAGWLAAVCHHATIAAGSYGWFAVRGPVRVIPDADEISMDAGDDLALGVDGGFVSAPASLATAQRWGFLISSGVTGSGANALGSLGKAWITTVLS